jgi:hypothetical protein
MEARIVNLSGYSANTVGVSKSVCLYVPLYVAQSVGNSAENGMRALKRVSPPTSRGQPSAFPEKLAYAHFVAGKGLTGTLIF